MLNVITLRTGNRYGVEYVEKMYSMLSRHLKESFIFWCLSEDLPDLKNVWPFNPRRSLLIGEIANDPELNLSNIPPWDFHKYENRYKELPPEIPNGWWGKLMLFSPWMPAGDILYLDLDQIILGDITEIVQECLEHPLSCYSDHISWMDCKFGSAFMTFKSGSLPEIWELFLKERPDKADYPGGDQVWLEKSGFLPKVFYLNERWPDAVKSYKWDVIPTGKPPSKETKIVNFHGRPKMADVRGIPWIKENWG